MRITTLSRPIVANTRSTGDDQPESLDRDNTRLVTARAGVYDGVTVFEGHR